MDVKTGKPMPIDVGPETGYTDGFLNQCVPFEVEIKPRSENRRATMSAAAEKAEAEVFSTFS